MIENSHTILSIDIGTTNLKCVVFDENGTMILHSSQTHPTSYPNPGQAEQAPSVWVKNLQQLLLTMRGHHPEIISSLQGVSLTGQMHGPVFLGERGDVLHPCIIWSDTRAREETAFLKKHFTPEYILQMTGNPIQESFTLPKVLWLKNHYPDLFSQVSKIIYPKDYLGFLLTGNLSTDHSDASGSLMYDLFNKTWSSEIISECGFELSLLPDIIYSDSILGTITPEASKRFSLPAGIPVIKGGGDLATTALATGTGQEGSVSLCIGTAAQLLISLNSVDKNLLGSLYLFSHCLPNTFFYLGTVPTGGSSVQWFHSLLSDESKEAFYDELNSLTEISMKRNILFYPYLMGTGTPYFDYRSNGAFLGLQINHNRVDIVLSIMEGITFSLKDSLQSISGYEFKKLVFSGGATRFSLWPQIVSSILNLPVYVARYVDSAVIGAFLLGAKRLGFISDYGIIINRLLNENPIYPGTNYVQEYEKKYKIYKHFLPTVRDYSSYINEL